jgi:hypothetical protein
VRLKGLFGAMNQDSEVITVYAKIAAYFILTPLVQEHSLQQAAILFWQFIESLPNPLLHFPQPDSIASSNGSVGDGIDEPLGSRNLPFSQSTMLGQYVVANRIDEGSETVRFMDTLFCENPQDAREGLLPNVVDCRKRAQTLGHLQANQFAKVGYEVLLRAQIARTKPI